MTSPAELLASASYDRLPDGSYRPEARDAAVAYYLEHGLAAAHRETGVPKATLTEWLRKAGHDPAEVTARVTQHTAAASQASRAQVAAAADRALVSAEAAAALVMRRGYTAIEQMLSGVRVPALSVMSSRDIIVATSRAIDDLGRIRKLTAGVLDNPGAGEERRPLGDADDTAVTDDGQPIDDGVRVEVRPRHLAELFDVPEAAATDLARVIHLHRQQGAPPS